MSKRLNAQIGCPRCRTEFDVELYRSIWIEDPSNRALIFSDRINRFDCPGCGLSIDTKFSFMCTNVPRKIAVWFEPKHDPQIDKDVAEYAKHMGPQSFYAKAPRISDWEEFKAKIVELESTTGGTGDAPTASPGMAGAMQGFIRSLRKK